MINGVFEGNYSLDPSGDLHRQVYSGRIDWQVNDKIQMFVGATYTPERETGPYGWVNGVTVSSSSFPVTAFAFFALGKGISVGATQMIRQNLINNLPAGITYAQKTSSAADISKISIASTGINLPSLYLSAPNNGILPKRARDTYDARVFKSSIRWVQDGMDSAMLGWAKRVQTEAVVNSTAYGGERFNSSGKLAMTGSRI